MLRFFSVKSVYIKPTIHTPTHIPTPQPQNPNLRTWYEEAIDMQSNNVCQNFIIVISLWNMVLPASFPPPLPESINKPTIIYTFYHSFTF